MCILALSIITIDLGCGQGFKWGTTFSLKALWNFFLEKVPSVHFHAMTPLWSRAARMETLFPRLKGSDSLFCRSNTESAILPSKRDRCWFFLPPRLRFLRLSTSTAGVLAVWCFRHDVTIRSLKQMLAQQQLRSLLEALVSRMDISSLLFDRYNEALYAKQAVLEN